MDIKEFIKDRLHKIAKSFPPVGIRYIFDGIADMHIVELTPQSEYYDNHLLNKAWVDLSLEMLESYPNDMITFISDDSTLTIEKPEFEFNYKKNTEIVKGYVLMNFLFDPFADTNTISFSQSFSTHNVRLRETRFGRVSGWQTTNNQSSFVDSQLHYSTSIETRSGMSCEDDCAIAA